LVPTILVLILGTLSGGTFVMAHSPLVDADLSDWCVGAFSNTAPGGGRIEDSSARLSCGNCSVMTDLACEVTADCPASESCINLGSKTEVAWWDNRTDGAVNDLGTLVLTHDNTNLYIAAELWVDPDPVSLPFAEIGLDFRDGGINTWYDPAGAMTTPGHCSSFTDRACTSDDDCNFCQISTEPFPSTRVRTCGSACDPDIGDVCDTSQTCVDLGAGGVISNVGLNSSPQTVPDFLVVFDFSRWLIGFDDATLLMGNVGGTWTSLAVFLPAVNPGASGGSGGPPGSVEVAIPWSAFMDAGVGPGVDYRYTIIVARGSNTLDYTPDGAVEDVMSEPVAGATTTTTDSCPGFGIGNTNCEIADGSIDSFVPAPPTVPGGRVAALTVDKAAGTSITLTWGPSCSTGDGDFEVYQGDIGNFYSHGLVSGLCSTSGSTTTTIDAGVDGSFYYVVVPTDGATEGSYGENSSAVERPVGSPQCATQSLGNCP
jgi:hypothetical protein